MNGLSLNNRFVLEPYLSDRAIKLSQNGSGFAMIQQKVTVVGLKILMDVMVKDFGSYTMDGLSAPKIISKGSIAYIREEFLHTQPWAKTLLESKAIEGKFMIVDMQFIEFIDYK